MPFQPKEMTEATLKGFVDRLHRFSKATPPGISPKRAWSQEAIARALGFPSFHAAQQALAGSASKAILSTSAWSIPCPKGAAGLSAALFPQAEDHVVRVDKTLMAQHVLLLAREAERTQALLGLIHSSPQQPVLFVRGPASIPAASKHGLPERSFNALHGYSAALDCLFVQGTAGDIGEAVIADLDDAGSDNAMWRSRAISLLSCVLQALVWQRDHHQKTLNRTVLGDHLFLSSVEKLAFDTEIPAAISNSLKAYLRSLPGYQEGAERVSATAIEQHGFLQMQFTRFLHMHEEPLQPLARMALHLAQETNKAGSMTVFMEAWAQHHQGGLMVFDGLTATSPLYEWMTTAMGKLEAMGHSVVVGGRSLSDLSDARNEKRITSRLGIRVVLQDTPDSEVDANKLGLTWYNSERRADFS